MTGAIAVTPSDTVDIKAGSIGINVGASGFVNVIYAQGTAAVVVMLVTGDNPHEVSRVLATGTTATNISALY